MSVILVAEQDAGHVRHIVKALRSEGWTARTVESRSAAMQSAATEMPSLVLASSTLPEAAQLLGAFARSHGGPGSVVMVAERDAGNDVSAADYQADEMLVRPCSDEDLKQLVRQFLSLPAPEPSAPKRSTRQLTSAEIFGDVLAEVEAEAERARKARARSKSEQADNEIERRLEETLSGVLSVDQMRRRSKKQAAKTADAAGRSEIDALLGKTLASLEQPSSPSPPPSPPPAAELEDAEAPRIAPPPKLDLAPVTRRFDAPAEIPRITPPPPLESPPLDEAPSIEAPPMEAVPPPSPKPDLPPVERRDGDAPEEIPRIESPPFLESPPSLESPSMETVPPSPLPETVKDPLAGEAPPTVAFDFSRPPASIAVEPAAEVPDAEVPDPPPPASAAPTAPAGKTGTPDPASDIRFSDSAERDGEIFLTQPFPVVTQPTTPDTPDRAKESPEEPTEGTVFGDYTLLDRIAVGGMAEVWRARRRGVEGFQKTVAIKKILAHLTDSSDFVTMLIDEAKLAAQLSHHNIIQIYDLGKVGDDFFIAMEHVEGKDLRSILNVAEEKNWPLPIGLALLIVDAVARALDYAHRKRDFEDRELELVHRDVSPQNVLISYEGEIKLCDFGIVKAVSKANTTQMGALKGKLQYMSPEQAWGRSVDARSDIFSLGSVFFELLTGAKLFTGDSEISVLDAVRECRPRSPRELVPTIPKEVESIVLKALAKSPEDRYQRAGDLEHDIKSVLELIKPTPGLKDLAAYMDGLFRRADFPAPAPSEAPGSGRAGSSPPAVAVEARPPTEASKAGTAAPPPPKAAGGGNRIVKLLIAAVLAGVLAGAGYLFWRGSGSEEAAPASSPAAATPAPPAAVAEEPDSAGADPEGLDAEGLDTEAPVTADGVEVDPAAADGGEPAAEGAAEAEDLPLDLERLVADEVSKRREEMERDFEERKRQLQQEIEKAKKASEKDSEAPAGDGGGR